jgi:hypothetical protein
MNAVFAPLNRSAASPGHRLLGGSMTRACTHIG